MDVNDDLIVGLKQKFEMVSYLTKIGKTPENVFSKQYAPPKAVAKEFWSKFQTWVGTMVKDAVGNGEKDASASDAPTQFTAYETQILKGLVNRVAQNQPAARQRPPKSTKTPAFEAAPEVKKIPLSGMMYLVDNSALNDPNISAGAKVNVLKDRGNGVVEAILVSNPGVHFMTTNDNLTKEPI